jgi:AcrR family transcriptional regulator
MTRGLIIDTAITMLEAGSVRELTMRAVAQGGGLAERTLFRYFATRDDLLDAVVLEGTARLGSPEPPTSLEELHAAPAALYGSFEARPGLTKALLHPDLLPRMQATAAKRRWNAIIRLVDSLAPEAPAQERRIASANIRYFLAATTWHYYRFTFEFGLEEAVRCAEMAISQALRQVCAASNHLLFADSGRTGIG